MKARQLADAIKVASETKRVREFQFPFIPGFYVSVAYASKFILNQIREIAREPVVNPRRGGVEEERLNDDKLRKEYAREIIKNWRGLTLTKLSKLIPGIEFTADQLKEIFPDEKTETEKDLLALRNKEIPYSPLLGKQLMDSSIEFEGWIVDMSGNIENYSAITLQKEKELENL